MNNNEEWSAFLKNLTFNAVAQHKNSEGYNYIKKRKEYIDEMLTTHLAEDEKQFVEEILLELGLIAEHEIAFVYNQGVKDCIFLLKNLGVLA